MKQLRVLTLVHDYLVPPQDTTRHNLQTVAWKTEFDVISTLKDLAHDVHVLGVKDDLVKIQAAVENFKPHIVFNLMETFNEIGSFDQNLVSYLELLRVPYTGCNPRGLLLSRDKALSKKILFYHHIPVPDFLVFQAGQKIKRPQHITFPLIVKSLTQDASIGISQASIVKDERKFFNRISFIHNSIGTDAIVEQYIKGRELYVGVLGNNKLQTLPIWEMHFKKMPADVHPIATGRVKWSTKYQKKHGIVTRKARTLPKGLPEKIHRICKQVYRTLGLSGYARIDLRLENNGKINVIEANPNPQIAYGEDFAESAEHAGLSYEDLIQKIIRSGLQWKADRSG